MQSFKNLTNNGFVFKKRFGQNFIFDTNLLSSIVADAGITKDDFVIEVGAGAGTLTIQLAQSAKEVIAFEIDTELQTELSNITSSYSNTRFIFNDILKIKLSDYVGNKPFKVVANLPYYITTPVIFYFLENPNLTSITVMVQREVAERFVANAGTSNYGAVTAQLRAYGEPVITRIVTKQNFHPAPKIDSAVVRLDINKKDGVLDYKLLQKVIASSFAMRRKTLANNLSSAFGLSKSRVEELLIEQNLSSDIRGEKLDIGAFISLSNALAGLSS
ncbi:MAG: 16S rRNA (adenine(1518)-N(6)/adenine(1519)-N(6))-dimethyltransferase RsmA [Firmicutes bacterium]|nr:16S rRNA (adenine(1518)-N(6)/adenine(1519)-N(6))-dimethyltransferase RsmA [Bacillota bacterium]